MRIRAKVLTVATALVTTFAILPTFGAAAADTLEDGTYEIGIDAATYTVEVIDGAPVVDELEGVEFDFAFDDETSRVLDEFDLTVDGIAYEVEVDDDGTVVVTRDDDASGEDDDLEESDESDDLDGVDGLDDLEEIDEEDDLTVGDTDGDTELVDGVVSSAHGALVSTVAQCAPAGIEAREAGLPNHGFFVSAAAHGDSVDFEVDGASHTADFSSLEGAEEFCILADELLEPDDESSTPGDDVIVTFDEDEETDDTDDGDTTDEADDGADGTEDADDGTEDADDTEDGTDEADDGTDETDDSSDDGTDDGAEDTDDEASERASEARRSSGRDG